MAILPSANTAITNLNYLDEFSYPAATDYKPVYIKNLKPQKPLPIVINLGPENMTFVVDDIIPCNHDWKEFMVNMRLFKKCKLCHKEKTIKAYKKLR